MLNQRKNKSFNYKSKFSKEANSELSQVNTDNTKDFVSKWRHASHLNKRKVNRGMPITMLLVILVLLLICLYVLDKKYM